MRTTYDAVVVPGSVLRADTEARAVAASGLYHEGRVDGEMILVGTIVEVERMYEVAVKRGVPERRIARDSRSVTTVDNAYYAKMICARKGYKRLIVVASRLQAERSLAIFKKVFGRGYAIGCLTCHSPASRSWMMREKSLGFLTPLLDIFNDGDHQSIKDALDTIQKTYESALEGCGLGIPNLSLRGKQSKLLETI